MKVLFCVFVVASILSLSNGDLVDVASGKPELSTLVGLIDSANLTEAVNTTQDITLFAPTNSSIAAADTTNLQGDQEQLRDALLYHVHPTRLETTAFVNDELISTLDPRNNTIRTNVYNNPNETVYTANGAKIIEANINASNGLIQVINKFLVPPTNNIVGSIASNSSFSILDRLLVASGLTDELNGTVTLFAPTDAAFRAIFSQQTIDNLASNGANSTLLRKILLYHVVATTYFTAGLYDGQNLTTLATPAPLDLNVTVIDGSIFINNISKIIVADWIQTNGVIQVIDHVLIPPLTIFEIDQLENLTRLTSALTAFGLATELDNPSAGPFTEFAPTDAAFASFNSTGTVNETLDNILLYHLLSPTVLRTEDFQNEELLPTMLANATVRTNIYNLTSGDQASGNQSQVFTVNCAAILIPNLVATNGIVHVINKVLVPPKTDALTYINETADLSEFAALLAASNLTLNSTNPVTVFAPNNAAFNALSAEDRANLQSNETLLQEVLLNHFVAGTQCSAGLVPSHTLTTLQGSNLTFSATNTGSSVLINNRATVVDPDIIQTDGVVHVVDSILVPVGPGGLPVPPTGAPSTTGAGTGASTAGQQSSASHLAGFFGLIALLCLAL